MNAQASLDPVRSRDAETGEIGALLLDLRKHLLENGALVLIEAGFESVDLDHDFEAGFEPLFELVFDE